MTGHWTGIAGVAALAAAWLGPLPAWSTTSFTAHMTIHMLVVAVAAPLLSSAVAGSVLDPSRARPGWFVAIPASLVELVVVWIWHMPRIHHAARASDVVFVVEQLSFFASGCYLWLAVLGGRPDARVERAAAGTIALALTFAHMTLLGALLALTPRPLYAHDDTAPGWSPLVDQHVGGALMLAVSTVAYVGGGVLLGRTLLAARGRSAPEAS